MLSLLLPRQMELVTNHQLKHATDVNSDLVYWPLMFVPLTD